jgi:predicted lipoprotein with Yx(FWY)xxD motif
MKRKFLNHGIRLFGLVIIVALALVACTTAPSSVTSQSPAPGYPDSTQPAASASYMVDTVAISTAADIGEYLVDGNGMTLYYFTHDAPGKSNATAAIIANWPVFNPGTLVVADSLNVSDFGTITRDDGMKQATFKEWPLYYFIQDKKPGDIKGQGFNNVWFVVNPQNFMPPKT